MINLHQLMNELNKLLANSTYKASIDRNVLFVNNQGSIGAPAEVAFSIDGEGNKSTTPGNEWIENQVTQLMRKLHMSESNNKKSAFKTIAEMIVFNSDVELPTESLDPTRKLTVSELKDIVKEEFKAAKETANVKAKDLDSWGDAEIENQVDWMKALDIKEFFDIKKSESK